MRNLQSDCNSELLFMKARIPVNTPSNSRRKHHGEQAALPVCVYLLFIHPLRVKHPPNTFLRPAAAASVARQPREHRSRLLHPSNNWFDCQWPAGERAGDGGGGRAQSVFRVVQCGIKIALHARDGMRKRGVARARKSATGSTGINHRLNRFLAPPDSQRNVFRPRALFFFLQSSREKRECGAAPR